MINQPLFQFPQFQPRLFPTLYFYYYPLSFLPDQPANNKFPFIQASILVSTHKKVNESSRISLNRQQVYSQILQDGKSVPKNGFRNDGLKSPQKNRAKFNKIQLYNRNILPNTVNVIISYVRRPNKSKKTVERILKAMGSKDIQSAVKKFYSYQNFLKNNAAGFISRQAIQALMVYNDSSSSIFSSEEQHFFNKVFRILVRCYLRQTYLPAILSSKLSLTKRKDHLKVLRYLENVLSSKADSFSQLENECQ